MEHIAILRQNLPKFIISCQDAQFSNTIFKIYKLDLLWVPNFIPLEIYFIFGTKFFWNEGSILALMLNICYLVIIVTFLMVTLVVTARYLVVTGRSHFQYERCWSLFDVSRDSYYVKNAKCLYIYIYIIYIYIC